MLERKHISRTCLISNSCPGVEQHLDRRLDPFHSMCLKSVVTVFHLCVHTVRTCPPPAPLVTALQPTFLASLVTCSLFINGQVAAILESIWVIFRLLHSERYGRERLGKWVFYYTGPQYGAIGVMYLLSVGRILVHWFSKLL